jgi:quercetin dioxygenase-like cupin family protein
MLFVAACSKSEPDAVSDAEPPPAVQESAGSDSTVVDPDHYTAEFENDAVRIVRIKYEAGEESVMHYHPDNVAVFLTDVATQMTMPDGSTMEVSRSAGDAGFASAGEHLPKNISDSAQEIVLVELKARDATLTESSSPHATVVDPDHYTAEFENEAVCIVRIAYGAGEESVMHYHPDSVAVFLTDHLVEMTLPDGSTEEIAANAGDAIFIPAGQHLPRNISDSAWELLLIELK